jgi:heme exporter protein B
MNRSLAQFSLLVSKDLHIEAKSRQTLSLVLVLGILIIAVLGLGLGAQTGSAAMNATTVLWVAYLFSGVLCFEKTMAIERSDGVLAGLLMAPLDRGLIYLAKLASNLILMFAVAAVVTPVGVLFFAFDLTKAPGTFTMVMLLSIVGFAGVGTLFAAVVSSTRLQGGLLAMMVFPITLPLVVASTQLMIRATRDGISPGGAGIGILVAFDAIFLTVSWLVFEWVLEP